MKQSDTLDSIQMSCLMIGFTTGSASVYISNPLSDAAHNGAWLSLLLAIGYGTLILACVLYLHRGHNGISFIEYSRQLTGPFFTIIISIPIIGMLLFAIPGIVAGIGDFLFSVIMTDTPTYVTNALIFLTIALTVRSGIKVMARMFVMLVSVMLILSLIVLILAMPIYKPELLLPILPDGIRPVLHGAFITAGFPFGEIFLLSMVFPYMMVNNGTPSHKTFYLANAISGLMLILSVLCTLMVFGPASGYYKYSLYSLASEIQIAEIITRFEAVIGISLIVGSYVKASILLFILNQILCKLLHIKNEEILILPLAWVCLLLSMTMFTTPAAFTDQVYTIWPFTIIAIGCPIIMLLAIISWFKRRNKASSIRRNSS
jgi:spore germination protein KB